MLLVNKYKIVTFKRHNRIKIAFQLLLLTLKHPLVLLKILYSHVHKIVRQKIVIIFHSSHVYKRVVMHATDLKYFYFYSEPFTQRFVQLVRLYKFC